MIALICPIHGFTELGWSEYSRQKNEEGRWQCPICHAESQFVRVPDTVVKLGCLQCHKAIEPPYTFDYKLIGFFCDGLCQGLYRGRVMKKFHEAATDSKLDKE